MTIREIRPVASSPVWVQLSPAVRRAIHAVAERDVAPDVGPSPVPTHTTFESAVETAIAPTESTGWSSKTGAQWIPPSVVLNTPPEAAPK